ncbi:hypothetical protein E2K93_15150 [Thalassotalea sp. HSM 43]|uniref:hypothetical protein n=1 Tax=Thalassotalea sp. HSM 43 TaxID=2552945 RepID=UPI001081A1F3|nr:hypothetical protein [Thalassotalea sp. HSM 43]QBY05621.1 hypothetical protein E2K93_15150 [Thalassotalea sp. HSM 43]
MTHFVSFIRPALIGLTCLFMATGCVTSNVDLVEPLTAKTPIAENQGVVTVQIINTSAYPLPYNFITIAPKNVNESKKVKYQRLESLLPATTNSTIFASAVNAGSYSLSDIRSFFVKGDYYFIRGAGADIEFGTFDVKANQVTDLGTIIYYPKPDGDRFLNVLSRIADQQAGESLIKYFPFIDINKEVLGWDEDDAEDERFSLYSSIAQNPLAFNKQYLTANGDFYMLAKLGVLLVRTDDGEWQLEAVDSNNDLHAIADNDSGDILIGGDEGRLFFKAAEDDEWLDVSLTQNLRISEINSLQNNRFELLTYDDKQMKVLQGGLSNDGFQWQVIRSYAVNKGWRDADGNDVIVQADIDKKKKKKKKSKRTKILGVRTASKDGKKYVEISRGYKRELSVFSEGTQDQFVIDEDWNIVEKIGINETFATQYTAGKNTIFVEQAGYWSWTGQPSIYYFDANSGSKVMIQDSIRTCPEGYAMKTKSCMKDKKKVKIKKESFSFVSYPWFYGEKEALSIVAFSGYDFWTGPKETKYEIIKTLDGGANWQRTELQLPAKYCRSIITEVTDALVVSCEGVSSDIYQSNDLGETWQHVRQHEDF